MSAAKTLLAVSMVVGAMTAASTAQAADRFGFDRNTMQGWQRSTSGSAMVYGRLPFHPSKASEAQPQLGIAVTAPYRVSGAGVLLHTGAPKLIDLRLNATDLRGAFTASLHVGSAKAWSFDPQAAPGERTYSIFDSGISWVAVGLISAGVVAGAFALTENGS